MRLKLSELPANEEIFIDANILNGSLFPDFIEISKKYWLMATDAFHVATMKRYGITNIATKHFLSTRKISPYWACGVVGQSPTLC